MKARRIYVVSGLGADYKVLEKIKFPSDLEVCFLDWLIPDKNEEFTHYVKRMAERIDASEPFFLLGYSFGGIIVQEIHQLKQAQKVIILASIKSHTEKSYLIRAGEKTSLPRYLPARIFGEKSTMFYGIFRKIIDPKNPSVLRYFNVKDAYYLKWSIEKIAAWRCACENPDVIQIMGDKDIVFPIKHCSPDYIIKGGTHLFPAIKHRELSQLLAGILN